MNNRNEYSKVYGDLLEISNTLRERNEYNLWDIHDKFLSVIVYVLLMLVEDKLNELAE